VYDDVLLPVLARVRRDGARGALTAQESVAIAGAVVRIVDELDASALRAARVRDEGAPESPRGAALDVLACPARDEVDAAALRILASRMAHDGVQLELADAGLLAAEVVERVAATDPGVVVVASVAEDVFPHARYVLKRLRARFPEVPIVAACWTSSRDVDEACAPLVDAGATDVATTLNDTRDRVLQYRRVRAEPPRAA
jgi:hypothetical protein